MSTYKEILKHYWGYDDFRGIQQQIIESIGLGHDTLGLMPTGGGKSLTFQVPGLALEGVCIVVTPLIALMKDQVQHLRQRGILAAAIFSGMSHDDILRVLENCILGRTKFLYVSPERLSSEFFVSKLRHIRVSFITVDEAHCISQWGYDFRPSYLEIANIRTLLPNVPILALTATATPKVVDDICERLSLPKANNQKQTSDSTENGFHVFRMSFERKNLTYSVKTATDKLQELVHTLSNTTGSAIVYVRSRRRAKEIAEELTKRGLSATFYHAGLEHEVKDQRQRDWQQDRTRIIVATNAFGMGIDKPDVRFVIHHDIPKSLEGYYQETGRAGRDGGEGNCIAFYDYEDIHKLEKFNKGKNVAEQEIARELLNETVTYAESAVCRHKLLLHYFGEEYNKENCGSCDNCRYPKEKFDGKEDLKLVLEAVEDTKQLFKTKHIAELLAGKLTGDIKAAKQENNEFFGAGDEHDDKYWTAVIRQALVNKLLSKDIENYGILKITKEGKNFIKKPYTIMLVKDHDYENTDDDDPETMAAMGANKDGGADKTLFALLKDLRKTIAKQNGLPPFVIFQDPSLEDMAIQYPITKEEMTQIAGVGAGKAEKFGEPFIKLIKEYVEENEITRPNDMVVKSVVNNSALKIGIIQNIDKKIPLEDIAYGKGLEFDELLSEIESIVSSGTHLDINYYIEENIDIYHQQDILDYFQEAESDDVQAALRELGEDEYEEEEVRLMRIKFLSDVGN